MKLINNRSFTPSVPIYLKLANTLKERINSGVYNQVGKLESENELCAAFGYSRPTVRKALDCLVSEGLIKRLPKRGYFLTKPIMVDSGGERKVAIISVVDPYEHTNKVSVPVSYLHTVGQWHNFKLQHVYFSTSAELLNYLTNPPADLSAAVIFRPPSDWVKVLVEEQETLLGKGLPFVVMDRNLSNTGLHFATPDFSQPVRDGLTYFNQLGHRKVGIILGSREDIYSEEMHTAYQQFHQNAGIEFDENLICEIKKYDPVNIARYLEKYLASPMPCTALILGGGFFIHEALRILEEKKIKVPQDLSLIALCQKHYLETHKINLSYFQQPVKFVCERCFEFIARHLDDQNGNVIEENIGFPFIFGDTCAPL